jgi:hypothetical protein
MQQEQDYQYDKTRKAVLQNTVQKIVSCVLWGLLCLLKNMDNETKISASLPYKTTKSVEVYMGCMKTVMFDHM